MTRLQLMNQETFESLDWANKLVKQEADNILKFIHGGTLIQEVEHEKQRMFINNTIWKVVALLTKDL